MNKWIPVSETKPAGAQRVMCVVALLGEGTNRPTYRSIQTNMIYHNRQFKELDSLHVDDYIPVRWPYMVTHWRPLPPTPSLEEVIDEASKLRKPKRFS